MTTVTFDPTEPVAPSKADAALARESARLLAPSLATANGTVKVRLEEPNAPNEPVDVPTVAFRLMLNILREMANGNTVRVIPGHVELTTGEAAELLNVSRPFVVKLLDEGQIPSHRVGTHRRVRFEDAMAYRAAHRRLREKALDRLSDLDQELGLS
jgi:excisionase family DNA binding protein